MGKKKKKFQNFHDGDRNQWNNASSASQESLDEYIRVSRPSVVIVIISLLAIFIAFIVWGFTGTLPVTETITGVVVDTNQLGLLHSFQEQLGGGLEDNSAGLSGGLSSTLDSGPEDNSAGLSGGLSSTLDSGQDSISAVGIPGTAAGSQGSGDEGSIGVYCFLDASRYNAEAISNFDNQVVLKMPDQKTYTGTIVDFSALPVSRDTVKQLFADNEWLVEQCVQQDYNWWLYIQPNEEMSAYVYTLASVTLTIEEVAPIQFLIN